TRDGEIDLSLTAGYESILDVLTALLPGYLLRWHYRSQDDRLIAFSNAHIYDRSLVTFPGTAGANCLAHVHVEQRAGAGEDTVGDDTVGDDTVGDDTVGDDTVGDDTVDSVAAEVDRVVQLILQHATLRPGESLGVITMGIVHAERIDLAL